MLGINVNESGSQERPHFALRDHSGDVAVAAYGSDLPAVFAHAAEGLFSVIADLAAIREQTAVDIAVEAADREALLVDWLNELLYYVDAEGLLFRRFDILELTDTRLRARAYGERIDPARHGINTAVKAATYHALSVSEGPPALALVVLDL